MICKESDFLSSVIEYAHLRNWKCAHFRTSMNQRGQYLTAGQADATGFLDLVLVRDRVVWAELKSEKGKVSDAQLEWIKALAKAGQKDVYVWKPSDWAEIERILN